MAWIYQLKDRCWLSVLKNDSIIFCLHQNHFKYDTDRLKVKNEKRYITPTVVERKQDSMDGNQIYCGYHFITVYTNSESLH